MKKLLFSAVALVAFGFVNAQEKSNGGFSKGDVFASGAVGFGSSKTDDVKSSSFTFAPAVGYFVTENIAAGARLNFGSASEDVFQGTQMVEEKTSSFGLEAFARYYYTPASQFSVYGELAIGVGSEKTEVGTGEYKEKTFGVNAGVGVSYFLNSNFAIEAGWAGLGYNTNDNGGNGAPKTNDFGLNVDLSSVNFGLVYKF
ncbi:MAG: porin family protein [Flavobacterium sp.]|jgi:outer membrane protein